MKEEETVKVYAMKDIPATHVGNIIDASVSPDGRWIVSTGEDA